VRADHQAPPSYDTYPLLFLAAMVVLATEYRVVNIIFAIIATVPLVVRWIERKAMRRRSLRDDG
jgi:hypothetical protein